jgi:iron complex outermembrane receptor protein
MADTSRIAIAISALGGLAWSVPAAAQAQDPAAAAAPAAQASDPDDGEIVVTAQRREERLSDVPIAVTALDSDQLRRNVIVNTQDLTVAVPGLNWGRSTNFNQPTIRGIGSRNASSGDEPNVASFLDGVYLPDMTGTLFELSNIERIEVLRGPQTTLFGRNATGGAINLITRSPGWEYRGGISASYGEFDYYKVGGYISGPIIDDVLAASLTTVRYADDGYIRNIYTGDTQGQSGGKAVRARILLQATPELSFQLNGLWSRSYNNVLQSQYALDGNSQARNSIPGGPTAGALNPTGIPANILIADQPFTTATPRMPTARTTQKIGDLRATWDLGFATLSGLAAFGSTTTNNENWTDNSPIALSNVRYNSLNDFRYQEILLTSNGGGNARFNWLLGFNGFQSDASFDPLVSIGRSTTTGAFLPVTTIYGQDTRAIAFFGEATWQPIEHLFLTGGLRYNRDRKEAFNLAVATGVRTTGSAVFENLSPRAVVRYEFANNSNVYASFTQGFKSGTFNSVAAAGTTLPARPEVVDAYEIGVKARLLPGVRLEAAAFHYDYSDLQVSTPVVINGVSATTVQNAGVARINGIEASLIASITDNFQINAGIAWLDTKIEDFGNASVQVPRTNLQGVPTLNGNLNVVRDVSGNQLIRAPRYTFTLGATYTVPLFGGELITNATAFFSDRYYFDLTNRLFQPAYEVVNASITWRAQEDRGFYVSVFGQNLTDQVYASGFIISSFIDASQANKPRWFGATVGFDF